MKVQNFHIKLLEIHGRYIGKYVIDGEEIPFLKTLQLLQFILFLDSMQSYKYKKTLAA